MKSTAVIFSRASLGMQAPLVTVEVHLTNGLPNFTIVGLPEAAVRESRERVRSALINAQFEFPVKRITVNLAPADLPKEGGRFDLPIALGILAAMNNIKNDELGTYEFVGELALTGDLRPISGVLAVAVACATAGRTLVIPAVNAQEAAIAENTALLAATHLLAVVAHINGEQPIEAYVPVSSDIAYATYPDLQEVQGHEMAKEALAVAAAGGHSLLFLGPPGTGKTLLASCLPGLLPPLSRQEALEVATIFSLAAKPFKPASWQQRPFRAPHHSASNIALVGGGGQPKPGEISLAHHGILFLDELPEFKRSALETLREPLESGKITISRAAQQIEFPAVFQLIAAMNPCPCGYAGDPEIACHCTAAQIQRYRARLSGPLLDRIDMQLEIARLAPEQFFLANKPSISSATIRQRAVVARDIQWQRQGKLNCHLSPTELETVAVINNSMREILLTAMKKQHLSLRATQRILRVARTIADLDSANKIAEAHVLASLSYRQRLGIV